MASSLRSPTSGRSRASAGRRGSLRRRLPRPPVQVRRAPREMRRSSDSFDGLQSKSERLVGVALRRWSAGSTKPTAAPTPQIAMAPSRARGCNGLDVGGRGSPAAGSDKRCNDAKRIDGSRIPKLGMSDGQSATGCPTWKTHRPHPCPASRHAPARRHHAREPDRLVRCAIDDRTQPVRPLAHAAPPICDADLQRVPPRRPGSSVLQCVHLLGITFSLKRTIETADLLAVTFRHVSE